MAESQTGVVGEVWGLGTTSATGTGIGTIQLQGLTFARESERATIKGPTGQDKVNIWFNHKNRLTLEVVPSGTTIALAKAANICPLPGTVVTVTAGDNDT